MTTKNHQESLQTGIDLHQLANESSQVHHNVSQNYIVTTEDKLKLCLMNHQDTLKVKSDWKTPVGIFATLVTVLITADFKNTLGLSAGEWKSIIVFSCIGAGFISIKTLSKAYVMKNTGDINRVIHEIKKSNTSSN